MNAHPTESLGSAYLIATRAQASDGDCTEQPVPEVLLALKNVYLPPHGDYEFAALGSNAAQYVLPGGARKLSDRDDIGTLHRLIRDCLGYNSLPGQPHRLFELDGKYAVYEMECSRSNWAEPEMLNEKLAAGAFASLAYQSVCWTPLDKALSLLGSHQELQMLPWVAPQVMRAMEAGFSQAQLQRHAQMPHRRFSVALASRILREEGLSVSASAHEVLHPNQYGNDS